MKTPFIVKHFKDARFINALGDGHIAYTTIEGQSTMVDKKTFLKYLRRNRLTMQS